MRKLSWLPAALLAAVIAGGASYGEIVAPSLKWSGFGAIREGQIVKGVMESVIGKDTKSDHVWVQEVNVGLFLESKFNNLPAVGNIGVEIAMNNDVTVVPNDNGVSRRLNFYPFLSRADLLFNLIEKDDAHVNLQIGYFPYKYNSSVRNLGEYLFRSGTYPQYLITEVDFPMTRLLGLRLGGDLFKTLNYDVLLTSNTEWSAIKDFNLSAILAWKPHPVFEVGVGGGWFSMFSVDLNNTTPLQEGSRYYALIPGTQDTAIYNYTFAGHKLMGRLALDIRQLFPDAEIFSKEDLKIYSEAAVLGVLNYPISIDKYTQYDNVLQRIPVMVGFNWPIHPLLSYTVLPALITFGLRNKGTIDVNDYTHPSVLVAAGTGIISGLGLWWLGKKLDINTSLDVIGMELEYFGNPYVNSMNSVKFDNQPIPLSSFTQEKSAAFMNLHDDDVKWSIYAKKTFAERLSLTVQLARDHIRWYRIDYTTMDGKEALRKKDNWHYTIKFNYAF